MTQPSNGLAPTNGQGQRPKQPVALGRPQNDFDTAYRLSGNLAASSLLPDTLRGKPSDVLVTVLYGQELGLAPMQAIQSIYVVKGRPTISAQLWVALTRRAGHKFRVIDETPESCTVEVERSDDPGHPTRVTYTLEQARVAGLLSNSTWRNHPHAMLYARAASTACRRACPEIALGFYDEFEMTVQEPERPTLAQVAAERVDQATAPAAPAPAADPEADDDALLAEVNAIAAERDQPVDAEVVDDPTDVTGWPEVAQPGGAR